jgi:hypothetical protein
MADPGKHSEFSPEELDRLEDALERWTAVDADDAVDAVDAEDAAPVPEDSLLTPPLRARLADYRSLMRMARAELPMEDVPEGLLADVFAEARHVAESVATGHKPGPKPDPREVAGPGLWERLRRSLLLPGFALAGTAAVMLWMVQPSDEPGGAPTTLAYGDTPMSESARLAPEASPAPAAPQEPEFDAELGAPGAADGSAAGAAVAEEKKAAGEPDPGATPPAAVAPAPADAAADARFDRKATTKSKKAEMAPVESYPGLDDAPTVEGDKEALRDTLEQADAARRKGRCGDAMKLYLDAMTMSGADSERATARAGYALCLLSQGDETRADKYFDAARKLSPSIDGWIKRERGDSPAKKAASKPTPRSKLEEPFMTRIDEPVK